MLIRATVWETPVQKPATKGSVFQGATEMPVTGKSGIREQGWEGRTETHWGSFQG